MLFWMAGWYCSACQASGTGKKPYLCPVCNKPL
jgi:hypothetical protein